MKTAIIGSANFRDWDAFKNSLIGLNISQIIINGDRGAARFAKRYAKINRLPLMHITHHKNLGQLEKSQNHLEIIDACECIVVFCNGSSSELSPIIQLARQMGKKISLVIV
ncbi:hypothetical protein KI659_17515 [Litoribacter alkaliphilus]|uniref:DUF2493 domain-containing protein n=1 Tax=Litoribacter ruber TaxID=702568 RepID=A0AAP2CJC5_9BACT|nr:hypothetical protein [Litoribacter alkaliphilus]MBS9525823.1 hypothetical protein [Litoribacter alkaliphilus]